MSSSSSLWSKALEFWLAASTARDPVIKEKLEELAAEFEAEARAEEDWVGEVQRRSPNRTPEREALAA